MKFMTDHIDPDRRRFLTNTGWLAAGVTVLASCSGILPVLPTTGNPDNDDASTWIQILADGRVRFFCPRMEMGQGATLGLSQIVAEELNVPQSQINCLTPDSDQVQPFKMTVGSEGLSVFSVPVSHGAASLREHLRALAVAKSGLPISEVTHMRGGFKAGDVSFGFGDLVPVDAELVVAETGDEQSSYLVRNTRPRQAIGERWKHPDLEKIVTGQMIYSRDVSRPGMLFGDAVRPPRFGATLKKVDDKGVRDLPGVVSVVIDLANNLAGVVADNPMILPGVLEMLDVQWQTPEGSADADALDVSKYRPTDDFEHTLVDEGDSPDPDTIRGKTHQAMYTTSSMAHAAMEPRAAVADVNDKTAEIWCGCQDPYFVRGRVAALLGRGAEDIVVHPLRMGGGFGGRVLCQPAEEAALMSAHVGKPVRVQWDRETEFQQNYFQPKFSHAIDSGLNERGEIAFWHHDFVSAPIIFGLAPKSVAPVLDAFVADEGTARGALSPYRADHKRVRYSDIRTDVPTGAWRGLGAAPNTFAIESMMDEMAHLAETDPLDFRLTHLRTAGPMADRLSSVLKSVADLSKWGRPAPDNTGLGIACAIYKNQTSVAVVAEVKIDHQSRAVKVARLWCSQDCGLVVNPDQVENQVLGNLVWGCNLALKEKLDIQNGVVEQTNFDSYNVLRFDEAPQTFIHLLETADTPPGAVGESAFAPTAAAIANATFAATGKRPRHLPFDYDTLFA